NNPRVATLDFLRCQRDATVHVMEVILASRTKRRGCEARALSLVEHLPWLRFIFAAGDQACRQQRQRNTPDQAPTHLCCFHLLLPATADRQRVAGLWKTSKASLCC